MDKLSDTIKMKLPKVVSPTYGLRTWIQDYKRDNIPANIKQDVARACYLADIPQEVFYNQVFTYQAFADNKYKLV